MHLNRQFLGLAMPLIIQSVVTAAVSAADGIMLGALSHDALSAVTLAGQIMQIFTLFVVALCTGATALLAQYYGNDDTASMEKVKGISLQFSLVGGIVFFAISLLIPAQVMGFFTNVPELIALGSPYLRLLSPTFLLMSFSQVFINVMKNSGMARAGSIIGVVTVGANIFLNALLIFGVIGMPAMGIRGAAIATTSARALEFILVLTISGRSKMTSFSPGSLFKIHRTMIRKFVRYTLPSVVQSLSWVVASSFTVAIIGHLGSDIVSANAVAIIVANIAFSVVTGYASAAGITAGNMLGRGDMEGAMKCGDRLLKWSGILAVFVGVIVCLLCPVIVGACHINDTAASYLYVMIFFVGFRCIGKYINTTLSLGLFPCGGDLKFLLKADIINMWLVVLPLGLISAYLLELPPIWVYIVLNLDEYYKVFFIVRHYKKYLWVRNLTKKEWVPSHRYNNFIKSHIYMEMPLGAMMISAAGKISLVNKAAARIFGMDIEDLEGAGYRDIFLKDHENEEFADAVIEAVTDKSTPHYRVVKYHRDGLKNTYSIQSAFVEEEDAKMGVYLTIQEIKEEE